MSFFEYLEKLRGKSERERRRILVLTVTIITAIIVAIWVGNISLQLEPPAKKAPGPLQVIGNTFGEGVRGIKEKIRTEFATSTIYQTTQ